MASVTSITADRAAEIEAGSIVDASINGSGHLILTTHGGSIIDVGNVVGATGAAGVSGAIAVTSLESVPAGTPAGTPIFLQS